MCPATDSIQTVRLPGYAIPFGIADFADPRAITSVN